MLPLGPTMTVHELVNKLPLSIGVSLSGATKLLTELSGPFIVGADQTIQRDAGGKY